MALADGFGIDAVSIASKPGGATADAFLVETADGRSLWVKAFRPHPYDEAAADVIRIANLRMLHEFHERGIDVDVPTQQRPLQGGEVDARFPAGGPIARPERRDITGPRTASAKREDQILFPRCRAGLVPVEHREAAVRRHDQVPRSQIGVAEDARAGIPYPWVKLGTARNHGDSLRGELGHGRDERVQVHHHFTNRPRYGIAELRSSAMNRGRRPAEQGTVRR
ncbi:MAG TPA: hypothetical protein VGJ28_25730 [Micromonosporaceae bacterium]